MRNSDLIGLIPTLASLLLCMLSRYLMIYHPRGVRVPCMDRLRSETPISIAYAFCLIWTAAIGQWDTPEFAITCALLLGTTLSLLLVDIEVSHFTFLPIRIIALTWFAILISAVGARGPAFKSVRATLVYHTLLLTTLYQPHR